MIPLLRAAAFACVVAFPACSADVRRVQSPAVVADAMREHAVRLQGLHVPYTVLAPGSAQPMESGWWAVSTDGDLIAQELESRGLRFRYTLHVPSGEVVAEAHGLDMSAWTPDGSRYRGNVSVLWLTLQLFEGHLHDVLGHPMLGSVPEYHDSLEIVSGEREQLHGFDCTRLLVTRDGSYFRYWVEVDSGAVIRRDWLVRKGAVAGLLRGAGREPGSPDVLAREALSLGAETMYPIWRAEVLAMQERDSGGSFPRLGVISFPVAKDQDVYNTIHMDRPYAASDAEFFSF